MCHHGSVFIPCPLCGSEDQAFFCEDSGMTFRRCAECGLVFLNPRPAQRGFATAEKATDILGEGQASFSEWTLPRIRGFVKGARLIRRYKGSGRLLDIGCGDGRFLHIMREHGGFDLHGLEPDESEAARASRLLGIDIFAGTLHEAAYGDSSFDVVTLWDVLEHVPDPLTELREVRRILKQDGLLLARVPNLPYFRLKHALAGPFLRSRGKTVFDPHHHLTYFDRDTAGLILRKAGFELLSMRPSRSEYGVYDMALALKSGYLVAAMAAYRLTFGRICLPIDLLVLARPERG